MLDQDEIFEMAVALGCRPEWANGLMGWRWHCTCNDNYHGCDQQCSAILKGRLEVVKTLMEKE